MSTWIGLVGKDGIIIPPTIVGRVPESMITWRLRIVNNTRWAFENTNPISFFFKQTPTVQPGFFSFFSGPDEICPALSGGYELDFKLIIGQGDTLMISPGDFHIMSDIYVKPKAVHGVPDTGNQIDFSKITKDIS